MKKSEWLDIANKKLNLALPETSKVKDIMKEVSISLGLTNVPITKLEKTILEKTKDISVFQENLPEIEDAIDSVENEQSEEVNEIEEVKEVARTFSEIELLRAECKMYGVGYGEKHTINDLTQLLNAIKGAGVQPTMTLEQALGNLPATETSIDTNGAFEVTLDNIDEISAKTPSLIQQSPNSASIQLQTKKIEVPVQTVRNNLEVYRDSFNNTIKSHWRKLSVNEFRDMFTAQYPFTTQFNHNGNSENQIEALITQHGVTVRIPSQDKNEWIELR